VDGIVTCRHAWLHERVQRVCAYEPTYVAQGCANAVDIRRMSENPGSSHNELTES